MRELWHSNDHSIDMSKIEFISKISSWEGCNQVMIYQIHMDSGQIIDIKADAGEHLLGCWKGESK